MNLSWKGDNNEKYKINWKKALEFREELIKLCKKYNCEMSGNYLDNGDIDLTFYDKNNNKYEQYIMKNYDDNYNLYKENLENYGINSINSIMSKVILGSFNHESGTMTGLNNIKVY